MDEWGRDPSVQAMRKVFKGMEKSLEEILGKLDISPYDHRIRGWLEKALAKFEGAWGVANQMGIIFVGEIWRSGASGAVIKRFKGSGFRGSKNNNFRSINRCRL
jgi:hypothetical protein